MCRPGGHTSGGHRVLVVGPSQHPPGSGTWLPAATLWCAWRRWLKCGHCCSRAAPVVLAGWRWRCTTPQLLVQVLQVCLQLQVLWWLRLAPILRCCHCWCRYCWCRCYSCCCLCPWAAASPGQDEGACPDSSPGVGVCCSHPAAQPEAPACAAILVGPLFILQGAYAACHGSGRQLLHPLHASCPRGVPRAPRGHARVHQGLQRGNIMLVDKAGVAYMRVSVQAMQAHNHQLSVYPYDCAFVKV